MIFHTIQSNIRSNTQSNKLSSHISCNYKVHSHQTKSLKIPRHHAIIRPDFHHPCPTSCSSLHPSPSRWLLASSSPCWLRSCSWTASVWSFALSLLGAQKTNNGLVMVINSFFCARHFLVWKQWKMNNYQHVQIQDEEKPGRSCFHHATSELLHFSDGTFCVSNGHHCSNPLQNEVMYTTCGNKNMIDTDDGYVTNSNHVWEKTWI